MPKMKTHIKEGYSNHFNIREALKRIITIRSRKIIILRNIIVKGPIIGGEVNES